jgi:hypothetical protein
MSPDGPAVPAEMTGQVWLSRDLQCDISSLATTILPPGKKRKEKSMAKKKK